MIAETFHQSLSRNQVSLSVFLQDQLKAVDACIHAKMQSSVGLIPEIAGYLITLGGKRLRPLLTLAAAELCGYQGERHISLAACVEFIHSATLLHDDVVDESALRRGKKTANMLWDKKLCVLVGDFLFSRALELMIEDGSLDVMKILSKASTTLAEGEVLQLSSSHQIELTQETYLKIIEAKTACLFSAAAEVGGVVGEADPLQRKALAEFGQSLGVAFQLMDDVLDYSADQNKIGKTIGDDFREGKVTLPVILAYQEGKDAEFWRESFGKGTSREKDFFHAISLLQETGALTQTIQMAHGFVEKAVDCLKSFSDSSLKRELENLAYFSINREI